MDVNEIQKEIRSARSIKDLDEIYKKYLGKRGLIAVALRELAGLPLKEKKEKAPQLQKIKFEVEKLSLEMTQKFKHAEIEERLKEEWIDISAPGVKAEHGHLHPLTKVQDKMCEIFTSLGFEIAEGPEIETEWYNFDALNIPANHPARDMWDTFWIKTDSASTEEKLLLRTHTSPVQVRYMESHHPPFRIIAPGRVFRHEASDASHDIQFYQLEGLMVDKDISVANFQAVIDEFLRRLFGENVKTRLRPSFFPFTEPSFEIDMDNGNGWIEIMGAGMVHPNVFKSVGYDPKGIQGFAFGVGIDRVAMMKYKVDDIRLFYSGDLRFSKQF